MPKNIRGGKRHKKGKNNTNSDQPTKITYADDDQVYALVIQKLGGNKLAVDCSDDKKRIAIIPGKFRKKVWMNPGDVILCSLEGIGDDDKCYVDYKYRNTETNVLMNKGLISFENSKKKPKIEEDEGFSFKNKNKEVSKNKQKENDAMLFPNSDSDEEEMFYNPNKGLIPSRKDNFDEDDEEEEDEIDEIDLDEL